ncbi:MAG: hypothetical protein AB7W59_06165, partial [Acidimicrobiia bacterium]
TVGHTTVWKSGAPLVLGILHGIAWEGALTASATASIGSPDNWENDELGVSAALGASATASAVGSLRMLSLTDPKTRTFAAVSANSVYAGSLAAAVDELLVGDLKSRVAAWILELCDRSRAELARDETTAEDIIEELAPDSTTLEGTLDDALSEWSVDAKGALAVLLDRLRATARPTTKELLDQLARLRSTLVTASRTDDVERVDQFSAALEARRTAKAASRRPFWSRRPSATPAPDGPRSVLRLSEQSFKGSLAVNAAAGAEVLERALEVAADASLEYLRRRVRFRFQVAGDTTHRGGIVLTQDTVVTHNTFTPAGSITATSGSQEATVIEGTKTYGTITYRSVAAYWLAGRQTQRAFPNGSGVSFGLSIDPDRLVAYAEWCRSAGAADSPAGAVLKTETYLTSQLRTTTEQLRPFFAAFDFGRGELDRPVLVEAGFAFTEPVELTRAASSPGSAFEPADLFDLGPARRRLDQKVPGVVAGSELQALRVRYPLGAAEDASRTLFKVGIAVAVGISAAAERVERIGTQGAVDLHSQFFPDLFAGAKNATQHQGRSHRFAAQVNDLAVAPVALFGETG